MKKSRPQQYELRCLRGHTMNSICKRFTFLILPAAMLSACASDGYSGRTHYSPDAAETDPDEPTPEQVAERGQSNRNGLLGLAAVAAGLWYFRPPPDSSTDSSNRSHYEENQEAREDTAEREARDALR